MADIAIPDGKRLRFMYKGSMIDVVMCRCGRRMVKFGWFHTCPAKRWWNFYLHFKR